MTSCQPTHHGQALLGVSYPCSRHPIRQGVLLGVLARRPAHQRPKSRTMGRQDFSHPTREMPAPGVGGVGITVQQDAAAAALLVGCGYGVPPPVDHSALPDLSPMER